MAHALAAPQTGKSADHFPFSQRIDDGPTSSLSSGHENLQDLINLVLIRVLLSYDCVTFVETAWRSFYRGAFGFDAAWQ